MLWRDNELASKGGVYYVWTKCSLQTIISNRTARPLALVLTHHHRKGNRNIGSTRKLLSKSRSGSSGLGQEIRRYGMRKDLAQDACNI
jgi:hypothetical protein